MNYNDVCNKRAEELQDDINKNFQYETEDIIAALDRALVDRKDVWKVFLSLRVDWLKSLEWDPISGAVTSKQNIFDRYLGTLDSTFDVIGYDIGHGDGHGGNRINDIIDEISGP